MAPIEVDNCTPSTDMSTTSWSVATVDLPSLGVSLVSAPSDLVPPPDTPIRDSKIPGSVRSYLPSEPHSQHGRDPPVPASTLPEAQHPLVPTSSTNPTPNS